MLTVVISPTHQIMAKKKKAFSKRKWISAYKDFLLQRGMLPKTELELIEFAGKSFEAFRKKFSKLEHLETAVIRLYFKEAHELLVADAMFHEYSNKDKQLAFLYVLIEKATEDKIFLQEFQRAKKWDQSFAIRLLHSLNAQELAWASMNWNAAPIKQVGINPKQMVLIQHALSAMAFFLRDTSKGHEDTDAYIEKSTDVLFKLTDTSTLRSMVDLGRFLFSRKEAVFNWD